MPENTVSLSPSVYMEKSNLVNPYKEQPPHASYYQKYRTSMEAGKVVTKEIIAEKKG